MSGLCPLLKSSHRFIQLTLPSRRPTPLLSTVLPWPSFSFDGLIQPRPQSSAPGRRDGLGECTCDVKNTTGGSPKTVHSFEHACVPVAHAIASAKPWLVDAQHLALASPWPHCAMPRRSATAAALLRESCDVHNIHREWKEQAAVRHVAVQRDRLFHSYQGEGYSIKFVIKDAVHNQHVLIPMLKRMAILNKHPLPKLKNLAKEMLGYSIHHRSVLDYFFGFMYPPMNK